MAPTVGKQSGYKQDSMHHQQDNNAPPLPIPRYGIPKAVGKIVLCAYNIVSASVSEPIRAGPLIGGHNREEGLINASGKSRTGVGEMQWMQLP
uniref:Uncharacterized protein n=1 Tax=Pristionchus pacificus TaxID=54126 RepID=A0A2A6B7B9_PRIPA|eukprot:PDM61768.1 hypothetical protein PRIPAC_51210 [Pristionchus pacificus]